VQLSDSDAYYAERDVPHTAQGDIYAGIPFVHATLLTSSFEPAGALKHRGAQQLLQRGQWQFDLRLHARRARHPASRRPRGEVVEQDRFADARLAAHDKHRSSSRPSLIKESIKRGAFSVSAQRRA
jgi:hypothetical protein